MLLNHSQIAPARITGLLEAAEAAARRIPPAFPLDATVAVNPALGQTEEDLATASARLERVAGAPLLQAHAEYAARIADGRIAHEDLAAALAAATHPDKPASAADLRADAGATASAGADAPLPTVADLAAHATGTDWPGIIARTVGLWAAGQFDRGQALWSPAPGRGAYAAWRDWARRDLTPEIAGLSGFAALVDAAPDGAERAILAASDALGIAGAAAETAFHRLLSDLGGWAQHARWLRWQAELQGTTDSTLSDLLAIRLVWEQAVLAHHPEIADAWDETMAHHARTVLPARRHVIGAILQDAAERAHQRRLAAALTGQARLPGRPTLQAAFCIDVRSEVFRRALEAEDAGIETLGFAGFFGLPVSHRAHGSDVDEAHLPVLLSPSLSATSADAPAKEQAVRISARATRVWGRFRQAAVSSFAFVEAAGPAYGAKLVRDALGLSPGMSADDPPPRWTEEMSPEAKIASGAAVLKAMGLTRGHARLVLLLGHGAQVTNNPHESAYHCGACGGRTGAVSARLLASLLNDPDTRAGLAAQGIDLPADTRFLAGLHDTTTDRVTLYEDGDVATHRAEIDGARTWLDAAARRARTERALRLPGGRADTVEARAADWAQVRPEWGLAGCAAFIAAPRAATAGADLGGRAFLHTYDWQDDDDFRTLELILTAPVVVASWISLQYYGSSVAPAIFGSGNKLIHNVVGGIGVVEGNGGTLRAGLPWQAVHDGENLVHDPLRLTVLIEAPEDAIAGVLERHANVRELFDNGWLHLLTLKDGRVSARYRPGPDWSPVESAPAAAA